MKILGIDYGERRIGIAISDENQKVAFPKFVLKNDKELFSNLREIIEEEEISKIVLGESKDFKMKDNPIMEEINSFKDDLEDKFDLEVVLHPEVLSSHQAAKMAWSASDKSSAREAKNEMIDASSATIILQSYLDLK
jgi:putative Holliday junction resolvase